MPLALCVCVCVLQPLATTGKVRERPVRPEPYSEHIRKKEVQINMYMYCILYSRENLARLCMHFGPSCQFKNSSKISTCTCIYVRTCILMYMYVQPAVYRQLKFTNVINQN